MICCGEDRRTTFCADCGKPLHANAGQELLLHLRVSLKGAQRMLTVAERLGDNVVPDYKQMRIMNASAAVAKWKTWVEWVEGQIAVQANKVIGGPQG